MNPEENLEKEGVLKEEIKNPDPISTPTTNKEIPLKDSLIDTPSLRTYKDDVKEVVKNQDITTTRILLEEQRKKANDALTGENTSFKSGKNKLLVLLTLILILAGGGLVGYTMFKPQVIPEKKFIIERPTFVSIDEQIEIATELRNRRDIYNDIEKIIIEPIKEKIIREVVLTKTKTLIVGDKPQYKKEVITTEEFFSLLEGRAPNALIRALGPEFMFAIFGTNVAESFLLFKVNDFENAFSSLLKWEEIMAQDFQPIFFSNYEPEELVKTPEQAGVEPSIIDNTSTSTGPIENNSPRLNFDPTTFEDKVIYNTDARVIRDEFNDVLFFYTFINEEFLFFAKEEKVLEEVIYRLRQASFIR